MSEIVKSEYNALDEDNNYKTHYFKTSADQVVGLGRLKNTEYQIGDVVYSDTNNKVALKCTTAGTTSNTELDVSTASVGESVEDGSVVWKVINRDYTKDYETIAQRTSANENEIGNINNTLPKKANLGALSMPSFANVINISDINITADSTEEVYAPTFYYAPCDGWLSVRIGANNTNEHLVRVYMGSENEVASKVWHEWAREQIIVPLPKGVGVYLSYKNIGYVQVKFFYAQSEV